MAKKSAKWNRKQRRQKRPTKPQPSRLTGVSLEPYDLVGVLIDVWRLTSRVSNDAVPEDIQIAVERLGDRVIGLGFEVKTHEGEIYQPNMRVFVVDDLGGDEPKYIVECLTPAVYYKGILIEPANVVIGGKTDGKTDS